MASNLDTDSNSSNLSLKLRTGSSGSRDSFYLDLDRGIDSDLEELSGARSVPVGFDDYVSKVDEEVDVVVEVVEGVRNGTKLRNDTSTKLQERKLLVQRLERRIKILLLGVLHSFPYTQALLLD